jgi:hypothetical protein
MTHGIKIPLKHNSKFHNKIYINHLYSYQMSILINTSDSYLVLININTRFAVQESIPNWSTAYILSALKSIFKKLKLKSLESDEEAAFVAKSVLKYLKKKDIDYYVVTEQRNNNISIIDRFIRTLPDWMLGNNQWTTRR